MIRMKNKPMMIPNKPEPKFSWPGPLLTMALLATLVINLVSALQAAEGTQPSGRELWLYVAQNLWVDKNVDNIEQLFRRAAKAGYTHVLLTDSKFGKLGEMDARYFKNVERVKNLAKELNLEIVPALFPIGYSNDLLWNDPNLVEALPVHDALFVVQNGEARLVPENAPQLKGGDFSNLKLWSWADENVISTNGAALIHDPKGANARIMQKLKLTPYRQYHLTVRVKTENFQGAPEVKILAGNGDLNYNHLGVKPTQDWTTHHVVFNSLDHNEANLYLGCWGGGTGSLWFDDAKLEEIGLVNLVRRERTPLTVREEKGEELHEGRDFEHVSDPKMGNRVWKGSYDIYHEPPVIKISAPDGTRLRVSYCNAVTVYDDQANICVSEPRTTELLRDQAIRVHKAWGAKGYMMSHDEIRVLNWCDACQARKLDAGALLADNVRTCIKILREVNPGGRIYVWSDMFDPNHNAHKDYYLVRGDLSGSWEGLDKDVIVLPWYFDKRKESLQWFANRGHQQIIAGYYDHRPEQIRDWLEAAKGLPGIRGVMYTTWQSKFGDLEKFAEYVHSFK
jgi:hypothetical protein